jgi:hypothetical protein
MIKAINQTKPNLNRVKGIIATYVLAYHHINIFDFSQSLISARNEQHEDLLLIHLCIEKTCILPQSPPFPAALQLNLIGSHLAECKTKSKHRQAMKS